MYKQLTLILSILVLSFSLQAQKGNNQVKLIVEAGLPGDHYNTGYGGYVKGLFGIGLAGQLTLTTGLSKFTSSSNNDISATTVRLIPFFAGYRQNLHKFYIEPQLGYGEFGGKIRINGDYARPSVAAFFWSVAAGINLKRFDFGLRYQSAHGAQGTVAGTWHNSSFHFAGIYAGVNLF